MSADLDREQRLDEVLAAYLESARKGAAPPRQQLLDSHPDLAEDLAAFFADQDRFARLAAPLRTLAPPRVLPLRDFGDYEVLEEIGRGGMGVVFKAWQKSLGRVVALKVLQAGPLASPADVARFRAEAEAAAALDHPHIVPIHEVGSHDGHAYLTMKFVEGGSLARQAGRFAKDPRAAARLVAAVARAVHHAHQRGILHRDLKPANILLQEETTNPTNPTNQERQQEEPTLDERETAPSSSSIRVIRGFPIPMVTDFGLAKRTGARSEAGTNGAPTVPLPAALTHTGAILGTPGYMAPEQAAGAGGAVTTAADVYGLGAVLYDLLTGRPPFRAAGALETLRQVREQMPQRPRALNPGIDRDLETVCLKCLEKEPGRRYASAQDLAEDLDRYVRGEPIQARPVGPAGRAWRWARRQPVVAALLLALAAAIGGGFVLVWGQWRRAEEQRELAEGHARAFAQQRDAALEAEERAQRSLAKAEASRRRAQRAVETFCRQVSDQMRQSAELQPLSRALLDQALEYYRDFLKEKGDDPRLRRDLAETHHRVGEIVQAIGTRAEARKAYEQSRDLYRELHRLDPDDREVQARLAEAASDAALLQDTTEASLAGFQEAADLYRRFLQEHRGDAEFRLGLAVVCTNLGSVTERMGRLADSAALLREARALYEGLLRDRPGDLRVKARLAIAIHNYAVLRSREEKGQEEALQAYREAHALRKELADAEPRNAGARADLAASLQSLGIAARNAGQHDEALKSFQQALAVRERLVTLNPRITRYQLELASTHTSLGISYNWQKRREESLRSHQAARDILDRLYRLDPAAPVVRKDLAQSWFNIGVVHGAEDRRAEEAAAFAQARLLQEALVRADPDNVEYRDDLSRTLNNIGCNRLAVGRPSEACAVLRQAIAEGRVAVERAPQVAGYRKGLHAPYSTLAEAECRLGHTRAAAEALLERQQWWPGNAEELYKTAAGLASVATRARDDEQERRRCLDLALDHLRQALDHGLGDLRRLEKDPALDPLRDHEGFRALLARAAGKRIGG